NTPIQSGKNVFGTGVNVGSVKREHDKLVEKKFINSLSNNEYDKERTSQLSRVEDIFNEMNSDGMNKILNRFFNTFREISNQPENETVRSVVRDNAQIVVKDFNRIAESITEAKEHTDAKIANAVQELNIHANAIANLNKEFVRLENM